MSPLKITVRSISDSPVINFHINKYFSSISKLCRKIHSCKVVIDTEHRHGIKAMTFTVSISLCIPGKVIVSKKKNGNLFVAIKNAFDTIEANLLSYQKRKIIKMQHYRKKLIDRNNPGDDPILPQAS